MVPLQITKREVRKYQRVQNQLDQTENPVCKVPLAICGHYRQLIIEELFEGDRDTENPTYDITITFIQDSQTFEFIN